MCSRQHATSKLFGFALAVVISSAAQAAIINVPGDEPTIQAGIDAANPGDEVVVASGIYTGFGNRDIVLGKTITVRSAAGPADCIVDCQGDIEDYHRGFRVSGDARLEGFTVTGGEVDGNGGGASIGGSATIVNCIFSDNRVTYDACGSGPSRGGGVSIYGGSPTLIDCVFRNNFAFPIPCVGTGDGEGGGVACQNGAEPEFIRCTFVSNRASGAGSARSFGGGLYNANSNVVLIDCYFEGNRANGGENGGGAVYNIDACITLIDCVFSANSADYTGSGGAMYNSNSCAVLINCTFTGNTALGRNAPGINVSRGGAVFNSASSPVVMNCNFIGNEAIGGGGGMSNLNSSSPVVMNCNFIGNEALEGGGMSNLNSSSPIVINCIFSGNHTEGVGLGIHNAANCNPSVFGCAFTGNYSANGDFDGVIYNEGSSPTVTNCTFSDNQFGAINTLGGLPIVTNCILWQNSAPGHPEISGPATVRYCIVEGGAVGPGNIDADPQFVGGPTGTWTGDGTYDPESFRTTFTDAAAGWVPDELIGKFLNPDTSQLLQSLIVDNTATTVTVWADLAALGTTGDTYQIHDYRLGSDSPCIDAADNTAVLDDVDTDLGGNQRFVQDPCTEDTGNPDGVNAPVDMGPYEFQPPCPADFDCNGEVSTDDLLALLAAWGSCAGCPEDIDNSGDVTVTDLLQVLEDWGACPTQ